MYNIGVGTMRQECTYSTPMEPKMNNKELSTTISEEDFN